MLTTKSTYKSHGDAGAESHDEEKIDEQLTPQIISSPTFQCQICDVVFTLIPEVPRLRNLFMSWESLTIEDKATVDKYATTDNTGMEFYKPLVDAFKRWDKVQDTQGAPGCEPGIVSLSGHPQIEAALTNVVYTLECLVNRLQDETCSEQVDSYNDSRLTSSLRSVYDEDRDRGDSIPEVELGLKRKSLSLDDIPKLLVRKSLMSL